MTSPTPDLLTADELTNVKADLSAIIDDAQLSVALTYKAFSSQTRTLGTGALTITTTNTSLRAIKRIFSVREIAASGGLIQEGDIEYLIDAADLSAEPKTNDQITEGSTTLSVIRWRKDDFGISYLVQVRKV